MNPTHSSNEYMQNFGQGTRMLEITSGRDCRLWPYIKAPDCTHKINLCKSQAVYGLPAQAYQGLPVHYKYGLSGESCPNKENYAMLFPRCKRCTDSARVYGSGCRCSVAGAGIDNSGMY